MGRIGKEVAGQIISFIGLIGVAVACGVPMWRVTSYIGANIVTGQIVWDGLWMNCVMQSTGQMQCKLNESVMRLSPDLQAARALVIISLIFGFIGFLISFIGAKCTGCLKKDSSKAKVVIIGGCLIIASAILILIPVCWSAAITITDFQSPLTLETQKREIGACHLHWLGLCCGTSDRWDHPNHFMSSSKTHVWIPRLPTSTNVPLCSPSNIRPCVCSPIQPTIHRDICTHQTICSTNCILYWTVHIETEWTNRGKKTVISAMMASGTCYTTKKHSCTKIHIVCLEDGMYSSNLLECKINSLNNCDL
uniref:Claudin f n=1 Tax=Lates calcarifer TaxID=8187 RepID=A0A4W6CVZ6_LATCA